MRVSNLRLQSVIGLAFGMLLEPGAGRDAESLKKRPLSHFGVSSRSLSRRLLGFKICVLARRGKDFAEKWANGLRVVRSTCRKCVRVARPRRKLSFSLRGVHFLNTVPLEPRLANGRTGSRAQRRGAPMAHYRKSAPLLAKSLTFVSEVQPSHT